VPEVRILRRGDGPPAARGDLTRRSRLGGEEAQQHPKQDRTRGRITAAYGLTERGKTLGDLASLLITKADCFQKSSHSVWRVSPALSCLHRAKGFYAIESV
jgi:hypothetical protein